ncbi:hypothetical protein MKX03_012366 [Papaver bracteatum]|nr:hypothetical protein MKX03_012366 [Papaver bracteatum]
MIPKCRTSAYGLSHHIKIPSFSSLTDAIISPFSNTNCNQYFETPPSSLSSNFQIQNPLFEHNEIHNSYTNSETYEDLISRYEGSTNSKDAEKLKLQIIKNGYSSDFVLSNTLINIYAKSNDMVSAQKVFDEMPDRNEVTWNCMMSGYNKQKMSNRACLLFCSMLCSGIMPSHYGFGAVLRACQDSGPDGLKFGMQVHGFIMKTQNSLDVVVCNVLMTMYGSCSLDSVVCARRVFDEIPMKNSISCNSIISVYSRTGDVLSAFELFVAMQREDYGFKFFQPSEYTFGSLITATYSSVSGFGLSLLEQIFSRILKSGFFSDLYVGSALVSGFTRYALLDDAKKIFEQMRERNAVSVNGLMVGLVKHKRGEDASDVFRETRDLVGGNSDSFVVLLSACAEFVLSVEGRRKGGEVHGHVLRNGLINSKVAIPNGLVNMYAKCGFIDDACKVFKLMEVKDEVSWNSIITGLDQNGRFEEAMKSFCRMRTGFLPSKFALISTLSSCASLRCIQLGAQLHCEGIKLGLDLDVSVSNALLALYADSRYLVECRKLFALMPELDKISWNSMIGALADSESHIEAVECFLCMMRDGWDLNRVTFINLLAAVSSLAVLELNQQVHSLVLKCCVLDGDVVENALISCYGKCGRMDDCEKIFTKMSERRDEVSWNSMISGYIQNGHISKAMDLVSLMMQKGQSFDCFTSATVLSACASVAALGRGMEIHARGMKDFVTSDVVVGSALVDMYAKSGRIDYALRVFHLLPLKNKFSWNSMISGYARNGVGDKALELFMEMHRSGHKPDHVTFVGILSACSHAGFVEQGFKHFESMKNECGLVPGMEHFSCMVDLLGRAGKLDMVEDFIKAMPVKPNALVWRTVLGACCRANGRRTDLGTKAAEKLLELEPQNAVNYVLLCNLHASGGRWEDVARARSMMKRAAVRKEAGSSWVTMKDGVHVFVAGDKSHPNIDEIYAKLRDLTREMKDAGYVPQTKFALYDLETETKEEILNHHSEKLAVAFVLLKTSGLPIRIMKNLRVCGDCHSAFQYISRIAGRQIVLRDSNRFHHFNDGKCSCGDYW